MIRSVTSDTQVTATSPAVNSFDEMIQSLPEIDEIDREDTRLYVERNFSAQVMAENYIRVYKKVMRNIP